MSKYKKFAAGSDASVVRRTQALYDAFQYIVSNLATAYQCLLPRCRSYSDLAKVSLEVQQVEEMM